MELSLVQSFVPIPINDSGINCVFCVLQQENIIIIVSGLIVEKNTVSHVEWHERVLTKFVLFGL